MVSGMQLGVGFIPVLVLTGHKGDVNSCSWSYSGQYIITASSDRTVKLWSKDQGTSLLSIDRLDGNMTPLTELEARKTQVMHSACFFRLMELFIQRCMFLF